jgi:lysosomal alpha-mannosidase
MGSVPIADGQGKEVFVRYRTDIQSGDDPVLLTDSNGRELQTRVYNKRPTFDWKPTQNISGNYYPVTAIASIRDDSGDRQFSLITDRSQGAASLRAGELELMLNRRLLYKGEVGQALNETHSITPFPACERLGVGIGMIGSHVLHLSSAGNASRRYREEQNRQFGAPLLFFAPFTSRTARPQLRRASLSGQSLPPALELMTLVTWDPVMGSYLMRFSHQYAVDEDPELSQAADLDIMAYWENSPWKFNIYDGASLTANKIGGGAGLTHGRGGDDEAKENLRGISTPIPSMYISTWILSLY